MDIKNLGINKGRAERIGAKSTAPAGAACKPASGKPSSSSDESLELTAVARALSAMQADAANPPFDAERVAQIRDAIAEGRYPIDDRRLASRLIELEGLLD